MALESVSAVDFEHWHTTGGSTTDGPSSAFAYRVVRLQDTYEWGSHTVPRDGLELTVLQEATGAEKKFYLAGHTDLKGMDSHMQSMTDELLLSFFQKQKAKKRDKQVKDPEVAPVQQEGKQHDVPQG